MPDLITLEGQAAVTAALHRAAAQLRDPEKIGRMTFAVGEVIRAYMVRNMLSGQRLRRQTGRLASSFHTRNLSGGSAVMGTNVVYAPVHEFGSRKLVSMRSKKGKHFTRRMNLRERKYFRDSIRLSRNEQRRVIQFSLSRLGGA